MSPVIWYEGRDGVILWQQVRMTVKVKIRARVCQLLSQETSKMLDEKEGGWVGCGSCKNMAGTGSSYLEKSKLLETSAFHNKMDNQQKLLQFLLLKENTFNHSTIYYTTLKVFKS